MWQPPDSPYGPPVGVAPPRPPKPVWVQVGLVGIGSRRQAFAWCVGTLVGSIVALVAIFSILYVWLDLPLVVAGLAAAAIHISLSLAALWYWLCIQWMDRNDAW